MEVDFSSKQSDASDSSSQAIIRACDMCRKKKIRCEPTGQTCVQCVKYKTTCHFTPISTKRKPRRPAGYKNVQELEERLRRMEGLLKTAVEKGGVSSEVLVPDPQPAAVDQVCLSFMAPLNLALLRADNPPIASLSQEVASYFEGLKHPSDHNESSVWESNTTSNQPVGTWRGSLVRDVHTRRVFRELPPKLIALVLIDEAFTASNATFPLFDQHRFKQYIQDHYLDAGPSDPGWWACINVILALAHRFRAMRTLEARNENEQACGYMQNALGVVSELTMLHDSLPAIQALVGMTIVLEGTPNPRLCSVLNAAALRLAQTMGLHRKNKDPTLSPAEIEERKNVFWIAYFLDRDISLRTGQPPVQDDDDMDVDLPFGTLSDVSCVIQSGKNLATINFFNARIGLAIIQGQIYKKLYSVNASRQSEAQQLVETQRLDAMLDNWRRNVPIDFDEAFITTLQAPIATEILHIILLRFFYVNCLLTVHRPFSPRTNAHTDPLLGGHIPDANSESICIIEARKTIRLVQVTPHGDYACAWLLVYSFFTAVRALLHNVLANPACTFARSDLQLTGPFLQLLEILSSEGKSEEVTKMFALCAELNDKAKDAVEEVNRGMVCSGDHMYDANESVEEFIKRVDCVSAGCPDALTASADIPNAELGEPWWDNESAVVGYGTYGEYGYFDL